MKSKASIIISSTEMSCDTMEAIIGIASGKKQMVKQPDSDQQLYVYTIDSDPESSERLEPHVLAILRKFESLKPALASLPGNVKTSIYCVHACNSYSGWTLEPQVLGHIAATKCEWVFGVHPGENDAASKVNQSAEHQPGSLV